MCSDDKVEELDVNTATSLVKNERDNPTRRDNAAEDEELSSSVTEDGDRTWSAAEDLEAVDASADMCVHSVCILLFLISC